MRVNVRAHAPHAGRGWRRGGVMPTWKGRRDGAVKWPSSRALPPTARHFTPGSARKDDASPQIDGQTAPYGDTRVRARPSRCRVSQPARQTANQPAEERRARQGARRDTAGASDSEFTLNFPSRSVPEVSLCPRRLFIFSLLAVFHTATQSQRCQLVPGLRGRARARARTDIRASECISLA